MQARTGEAAARDVATSMYPMVYTAPISRVEFLLGRFLAALLLNAVLLLAVQADGREVSTVEGLAPDGAGPADLHPVQWAFREAHGLQCGFCTPGILMTVLPFLEENPDPTEEEVRHALSGNLCRCTGYQHIVNAVQYAAQKRQ